MSDHLIQQLDPTKWRLQLMGQAALLIEYDGWLPTSAFQHLALECRTDWSDVREAVAGYDSVVLQFGNACDMAYCRKRLAVFSIPADGAVATQTHLLTVDFSAGMDWGFVVDHSGFRRDAFIFRFCQTEFHVAMLGFLPGFVYLDGLPKNSTCHAVRRLALILTRVLWPSGADKLGFTDCQAPVAGKSWGPSTLVAKRLWKNFCRRFAMVIVYGSVRPRFTTETKIFFVNSPFEFLKAFCVK